MFYHGKYMHVIDKYSMSLNLTSAYSQYERHLSDVKSCNISHMNHILSFGSSILWLFNSIIYLHKYLILWCIFQWELIYCSKSAHKTRMERPTPIHHLNIVLFGHQWNRRYIHSVC